MSAEMIPEITFEQYLDGEQLTDDRYEWVAGRVFAMAGGNERHDLVAGLLFERLAALARRDGCRAFTQNRKVKLGVATYIPDVVVICPGGPPPDRYYERDLSIVVEVLSPRTENTDKREKTAVYASAPSYYRYLLVEPDRRRIEVASKDPDGQIHWQVYSSGHYIDEIELAVDELYDQVDAVAQTT